MNRPRFYRALRITTSAAWLLLAVLLTALWVRSYWWNEMISTVDATHVITTIGADIGTLYVILPRPSDHSQGKAWSYWFLAPSTSSTSPTTIRMPIWLLVTSAATLAAAPWIKWRYSLRTLLIVTTLIAVLLGLVVYASR